MRADLHSHTVNSDGKYTVLDVIKRASGNNIDMIGITDHDNLDSYEDYLKIKDEIDIDVLIGVELSTWYNGENVHILGYCNNEDKPSLELVNYLNSLRQRRIDRTRTMIEKLKEYYDIDISYEDVVKKSNGIVGRVHIASAISDKYGISIDEVFDKYIGNDSMAYVPTSNISTKDAIDLLHSSNMIAVWAHPVLNKNKFREEDIIEMGIDGLEGNYPKNSDEDTKHYRDLTNKYNLLFTGGSDFHDGISHSDIGTSFIEDDDINRFIKRIDYRLK